MNYILIFVLFISIVLILWIIFSTYKKTPEKKEINTNDRIEDIIKKIRHNNTHNLGKDVWKIYKTKKHNNIFSLSPSNKKEKFLEGKVSESENRNLITITQKNNVLIKALEFKPHSGMYRGHFKQRTVEFIYQQQKKRIIVDLVHEDFLMEALGGTGHSKSLPHPWYKGIPLLFMKSGNPVGFLHYPKSSNTISPEHTSLEIEIGILEKEKDSLPLLFFSYILLMELLTIKRINKSI